MYMYGCDFIESCSTSSICTRYKGTSENGGRSSGGEERRGEQWMRWGDNGGARMGWDEELSYVWMCSTLVCVNWLCSDPHHPLWSTFLLSTLYYWLTWWWSRSCHGWLFHVIVCVCCSYHTPLMIANSISCMHVMMGYQSASWCAGAMRHHRRSKSVVAGHSWI